ncbi:WD40/YVTN/BNR-like repeat-containing protein [Parabacteroides sp.]
MNKNRQSFLLAITMLFSLLLLSCIQRKGQSNNTLDSWQRIGPGGGGSTFIPTFSSHSPDHYLIRCDMTGAYLTENGGESYDLINFPNGSSCFAYDPNNANTIYIGSSFLSKSKDGGKTWERIFPKQNEIISETFIGDHAGYQIKTTGSSLYPQDVERISTIRVDPLSTNSLYFTMGKYFFYSTDGGQNWDRIDCSSQIDYLYTNTSDLKDELYIFTEKAILIFCKTSHLIKEMELPTNMSPACSFTAGTLKESNQIVFYAIHHTTPKDNPFAFTTSEVWISYDKGVHWSSVTDPVITSKTSGVKPCFTMISCAEQDASQAYVVSNMYQENVDGKKIYWYGVIKTENTGKSWNWTLKGGGGTGQYGVQDAQDAENLKDSWVHEAFGGEFIQLMDVGVSPMDGNIAITTDWYRTMKTMDGGKTWHEVYSKSYPNKTYSSRGMDVTTTYGVHFDPFDKKHIAISYTDIGFHHSFDNGKTWKRSITGVPSKWVNTCYWVVFDPKIKGKVWSVWSSLHDLPRGKMTRDPNWNAPNHAFGGVCVSEDGGKTWKPTTEGMGMESPSTSIILDPSSPAGNRTLYVCSYNKGVYKSTDDGKTWSLKNNGIKDNTCAFELTMAKNGNLFLVISPTPMHKNGEKGLDFFTGKVYKSVDGAENWTELKINDGLLFPNGIDIDPENPNRIYLGCWSSISLADLVGGDLLYTSSQKNTMIDMPGGIFKSEDGGNTWSNIFDNKQYVYDVTIDPYHPGRVYCNTFNKVAYRSDDYGKNWKKLKDYDFHWGHRIIIDENDHEKIFITTYGSSVWHGYPTVE